MKSKKKHHKHHRETLTPPPSPPPSTAAELDLKSLIATHREFFDRLIDSIPARFYLPTDDDSNPWFHGLSKVAKASAKRQARENIKKAKMERLDPEVSKASTVEALKQNLEKEKEREEEEEEKEEDDDVENDGGDEEEEDGKEENKEFVGLGDDTTKTGGNVTYEELRQRLHSKLEELRASRGGHGKLRDADRNDKKGQKRKRSDEERSDWYGKGRDGKQRKNDGDVGKAKVEEAAKDIEFGKIKVGFEKAERVKKRQSKALELKKARRMQERKQNPKTANQELWKLAESRAKGVKVHDNPKLVEQSIKKEKKRKEKSAGKWKDRIQTTQDFKKQHQKKRTENIVGRIEEKKRRKIEKREKKLTRPGFEGRKQGYIGD